MTNNTVFGADMGIWIKGSDKDIVERNTLVSCDRGLLFNSTNRTTVCNNTFIDTGSKCIELENSKCIGNRFYHNNMLGCGPSKNLKQARDNGTNSIWNTSTEGNFWSDWQTPDSDNNGIVDVPQALGGTSGALDNYPLTHPYGGPRIMNLDINTTLADQLYSNRYTAIDVNTTQTVLTWSLRTDALWLGLNGTYLNGTPSEADIGSYWVNVSVSDGFYLDFTNFTLQVMSMILHPIINGTGLPLVWTEDLPGWHVFGIMNPLPADAMSWSMASDTSFISISATGNLSGLPLNEDVGTYWVNVTVSDPVRGNGSRNFTLTVLNTNDPPIISPATLQNAIEDKAYWYLFTASDPDPTKDTLTWAMKSDVAFLSMNSGNISGMPRNADVGIHWVNVSVNDGKGGSNWLNLTLIVMNVNDAPNALNAVKAISIYEDSTDVSIYIPSLFSDIDGDLLVYGVLSGKNITANILANKTLELVPAPDWNGHETLTVSANDSHSSASMQLNVTVLSRNDAPTDAEITFIETTYVEGGPQRVQGLANDADLVYGDKLTFTWTTNRTGKIGEGPSRNLSLKAGYYTITLNVTDSKNAWTSISKPLVVLPKSTGNVTDDDVVPDDDVDDDVEPDDDTDDDTQNGTDDDTNSTGSPGPSTMVMVLGVIAVIFVIMIIAALVYMRSKKAGKREEEEDEVVEEKELIPEPKRVAAASTRPKEAPAEVFAPRKKRATQMATPAPAPKKPVSRPMPVEEAIPTPDALAPLLESAPEGFGNDALTDGQPEDVPDESGPGIKAEEPPKDPKVEEKKELDDIFGDL